MKTLELEELPNGYTVVAVPRLSQPGKEDVYAIEPSGRIWRSYKEYTRTKTTVNSDKDYDGVDEDTDNDETSDDENDGDYVDD